MPLFRPTSRLRLSAPVRLRWIFGAWIAGLTVATFVMPSRGIMLWGAIGLSSALAVIVGVGVHRPRRVWPWLLVAGSLSASCFGDMIYEFLTEVLGMRDPVPSPADAFYVGMYPLLVGGLLGFVRSRSRGLDRGSLLDAVTLTAGLGLLAWLYLINPYVTDRTLDLPAKLISIAYPLGDVFCLLTLARLLTSAGRRAAALWLLGLGTGGMLAGDALYLLAQLNGTWRDGTPIDLGWALFYGAVGLCALHPSMRALTEPTVVRSNVVGPWRIVALGIASMIAPAVLVAEALSDRVDHALLIALFSGAMFLLVLTRLGGIMASRRRAFARERGLREAGAALVAAADPDEVAAAVRAAVDGLMPAGAAPAVLIMPAAGETGGCGEVRDAQGSRSTDLVPTDQLPAEIRAGLGRFSLAVRCRISLPAPASDGTFTSVIYVAGPDAALHPAVGSLELLAVQAALALQRISLTEEITKRNSETYFRTLVQNASDVILIVDADDRIRYASPSAAGHSARTSPDTS